LRAKFGKWNETMRQMWWRRSFYRLKCGGARSVEAWRGLTRQIEGLSGESMIGAVDQINGPRVVWARGGEAAQTTHQPSDWVDVWVAVGSSAWAIYTVDRGLGFVHWWV